MYNAIKMFRKIASLICQTIYQNLIAQNITFERNPRNHNQFLFGNSCLVYCNIFMRSNLI